MFFIEIIFGVNASGWAFVDANLQCLPQFPHVQEEDIRLIGGIHARQRDFVELFVVTDTTGVSKGIVSIDQTYGIPVNKGEYGNDDL